MSLKSGVETLAVLSFVGALGASFTQLPEEIRSALVLYGFGAAVLFGMIGAVIPASKQKSPGVVFPISVIIKKRKQRNGFFRVFMFLIGVVLLIAMFSLIDLGALENWKTSSIVFAYGVFGISSIADSFKKYV